MRVVYLHGFASSPQSSKARYFAVQFAKEGVEFVVPRLDGGDFESLTITGQLERVAEAVGGKPSILMGSSLGGYLAACFASRNPEVERMVLMAPAFQFPRRWRERLTPRQLADWKTTRKLPIFHYGEDGIRDLGYGFLEDAAKYEDEPDFPQPALILHGTGDSVVPSSISVQFAASHPHVSLKLYPSSHELTDVLEPMWQETSRFLFQKP
jgi:pimeloyl-ACP methyl ester carboxylesterase